MRRNRGRFAVLFALRRAATLPTVRSVTRRPFPLHGPRATRAALALAGWLAAAATATAAQGLPALQALPPGALDEALALARHAAQTQAPPQARVHAEAGTPDPRLRLQPCARAQAFLAAGSPLWGRTRVGLRCEQGAVAWTFYLPVQVRVSAPAVLTRVALPAGARLDATQLQVAEVDWAAATQRPFVEAAELEGRVLTRPVEAGHALRGPDLQVRQWFAAGDPVRVVASGGGFSVSAEGQALSAGLEGQPVRVRTEGGRVVVGRATGERRVELQL